MPVPSPAAAAQAFALFDASDRPLPSSAPPAREQPEACPETLRILIVDDADAIHDIFRRVLTPAPEPSDALSGGGGGGAPGGRFELASARQGREALELVERSVESGSRFAVAFVDMRMPPGWDGLETIERIWAVDPDVQVVICTGHADYTFGEIRARLGHSDALLVLKKPFDHLEMHQMAQAMSRKWLLSRRLYERMQSLAESVDARTRELRDANAQLRREMEDRERLEQRLRMAQRLEAVGQLAGGVAHEINNPLTYIVTNLAFLGEQLAEYGAQWPADVLAESRAALDDAIKGSNRVGTIVRGLTEFARGNEECLTPVNLQVAIQGAARVVAHEIKYKARFVEEYEELPPVCANEGRLAQVFVHLLMNAAQAIGEGHAEANEVRVSARREGEDRVRVEVSDTGCGIPEAIRSRIFDPFFTTREVGSGTGLGLAIVHGVVTSLGGEVTVESEVGRGTTVRLLLPASRETAPAEDEILIEVEPPAHPPRRGRVLVVDDEIYICESLRRLLEDEHDVVAHTRGRDALDDIVRGERFDLILCDVMMPEMTAVDFHRELSAAAPDQVERMIFMTGGTFTRGTGQFLANVSNEVLRKPVDPNALRARIREQLAAK